MLKKNLNTCDVCEHHTYERIKKLGSDADKSDFTIALAGNPNTGKSTVFNALTGLRQHTGNWPGKTVARAEGAFIYEKEKYKLIDLPGTYSLLATSEDEEIARDFILFGKPDVTVIVVDSTRLERNLNLVLQILEITSKAVLCLNLIDEANRHGIKIDHRALSRKLGIPVVPTSARFGKGLSELTDIIHKVANGDIVTKPYHIENIPKKIKLAINELSSYLQKKYQHLDNVRWIALRLLEGDSSVIDAIKEGRIGSLKNTYDQHYIDEILVKSEQLRRGLGETYYDYLTESIYTDAAQISTKIISEDNKKDVLSKDQRLDRIVTSRIWGFPIMLLILAVVLWLTITGANYPSGLLFNLLMDNIYPLLKTGASAVNFPWWLSGFLIDGVYLSVAWVVSVMLPPMAIFFPIFTLLEDFGYLPRVAFNLDSLFKRAGAHGKQALTMTMGFGCNAAGVVAARIIDSPRERLIAIITNNFSLCNGRWPTQILIATIFIGAIVPTQFTGLVSMGAVICIALLGLAFMFSSSWFLTHTLLKGEVSSFTLELPPYRPPQFWKTLYTSLINRTLIVLWRAVIFAAPAGGLIWLICNINIGNESIAFWMIDGLDPFATLIGLNGVIILAYIVAIPANEIVIPTILMLTVLATKNTQLGEGAGVLFETSNNEIATILKTGGWTLLTAVNLMIFSMLHNPCSTTIYTIYKETRSIKWTTVATLMPIFIGIIVCVIVALFWQI